MTGWTAIIPLKPSGLAKSRLLVEPDLREQLAAAFALDVLDVVAATDEIDHVLVVTADVMLAAHARSLGMMTLADRPIMTADGLNEAVMMGRSWAVRRWPSSPVVAVLGDLPAMRPQLLSDALTELGRTERSFVPDLQGTGTTLSAAVDPNLLRPLFGDRSAFRHGADGVRTVIDVDERLRRDVDTVADLAHVQLLGVGPSTDGVLTQRRRGGHRPTRRHARSLVSPR